MRAFCLSAILSIFFLSLGAVADEVGGSNVKVGPFSNVSLVSSMGVFSKNSKTIDLWPGDEFSFQYQGKVVSDRVDGLHLDVSLPNDGSISPSEKPSAKLVIVNHFGEFKRFDSIITGFSSDKRLWRFFVPEGIFFEKGDLVNFMTSSFHGVGIQWGRSNVGVQLISRQGKAEEFIAEVQNRKEGDVADVADDKIKIENISFTAGVMRANVVVTGQSNKQGIFRIFVNGAEIGEGVKYNRVGSIASMMIPNDVMNVGKNYMYIKFDDNYGKSESAYSNNENKPFEIMKVDSLPASMDGKLVSVDAKMNKQNVINSGDFSIKWVPASDPSLRGYAIYLLPVELNGGLSVAELSKVEPKFFAKPDDVTYVSRRAIEMDSLGRKLSPGKYKIVIVANGPASDSPIGEAGYMDVILGD